MRCGVGRWDLEKFEENQAELDEKSVFPPFLANQKALEAATSRIG